MFSDDIKDYSDEKYNLGLQISEQEYRDLQYPSYSLFSDIEKVGIENVDPGSKNKQIGDLDGVIFGKIVDSIVTDGVVPSDLIVMTKKPAAGKVKTIINTLVDNLEFLPNKKNILAPENKSILLKACKIAKYYKDDQKRLDGINNYSEYIDAISDPKNKGKTMVQKYIYDQALLAGKKIMLEEPFSLPVNYPERYSALTQVKLVGTIGNILFANEHDSIEVKGMMDYILVDHKEKIIKLYDLKTGSYDIKDFHEKGYVGWNYYIQASLYFALAYTAIREHPIYKDYKVEQTFNFAYYDRFKRGYICVSYSITDLVDAYLGFTFEKDEGNGLSSLTKKKGLSIIAGEYANKYLV